MRAVPVVCGSGTGSVSHVPPVCARWPLCDARSGSHIYLRGGSAHGAAGDAAVTAPAPPLTANFPRLKGTFQYIPELLDGGNEELGAGAGVGGELFLPPV